MTPIQLQAYQLCRRLHAVISSASTDGLHLRAMRLHGMAITRLRRRMTA